MSNYTVLIVEDENIVALHIKAILTHLRHKILGPVMSGEAAIELVEKQKPDLILMDINLDGKLDGIETASIIKKTIDVPIVYLTAYSDEETLKRARISDPFGYILKPFNEKELGSTIEIAIYKFQTEEKLRQSETKYRTLIERMNEGIAEVDNNLVIRFVNTRFCNMLGYSQQELIGKKVNEILLFEHDNDLLAEKMRLRKQMISDRYEIKLKKKNESQIWVEISGSPKINNEGKVTGAIGIFTDISEKKKSENIALHLAAIVESSLDAIFSKTLDGVIISWNKGAELMYGYSAEEIIGKHVSILAPPEKQEEIKNIMNQLKNGESINNLETLRIKKDKQIIYVFLTISLIKNSRNEIIAASTICHDITRQKKAEESYRISQQRYKNIFDFAPIGIYLSNYQGQVLTANLTFAKMLGYDTTEEVLKLNLSEDIYFEKEERRKLIQQYENNNTASDVEVKWKRKDGSSLWVQLSVHTIKDLSRHAIYFEGFVRDITKHRINREQILKLSRAVEQSPVSIIILDLNGNIEYVNSKFTRDYGQSFEEIIGNRTNLLLTNILSKQKKKVIWDAITSGSNWKGEFKHTGKDGNIIWESAIVSPITNEKNQSTYYLAIFQDITKRKLQEEQLIIAKEKAENSDRLKSEFLAQISHEIRTPLNNILTYSSLIKEEFEDKLPQGLESAFKIIDSSSQRLIRTIELILNLSRIQTGNFESNIEVLDLDKDILEDLTLEFFSRAKIKNLYFVYENYAKNTLISCDRYSLGQVFINLIDNAIKYTDKGGVQVVVNETHDKIIVSISDTGIGISPEYIPNIFNPFTREDHGRERTFEGTGLGLALVKKYIEINNAEISVKSEKWKGSTFTVMFTPINNKDII